METRTSSTNFSFGEDEDNEDEEDDGVEVFEGEAITFQEVNGKREATKE